MRQLGRAPGAAHGLHGLRRLCGRGELQACELVIAVAREIGDVSRVIRWQAPGAHRVGEAVAAEMLHGAGLGGIGLGVVGRSGLGLDQQAGHTAFAEFEREHQAARAAPGDQHLGVSGPGR